MASRALIVGGGLIGLLSARYLRARGFDAVVLERGKIGREASWAGGGILSPLYPWRFPDAITELARRSATRWPEFARTLQQRTGIDSEYRRSGMIVIDHDDPEEVQAWAHRSAMPVATLSRRQVAELEPGIMPPAGHCWWLPNVASIRNPRLLRALTAAAVGEGVGIREEEPVQRVMLAGNRVTGVRTASGHVAADVVVVAAGAWSGALLSGLGAIPPRIRPVRGQMLAYRTTGNPLRHVVLSHARYLIPRRDGIILVGSTVEDVGYETVTTGAARAELTGFAGELCPALRDRVPVAHWAGLRPGSDDGVPTIAPHPVVSGLWANTGHYRNGIATALESARLLACLIAGDVPELNPGPYAWPPGDDTKS